MINLKKKSKGERWNIMKNQLFHAIGFDSTISLSQHKKNNNIVVADHTTEKKQERFYH
jgi:hypothetical protein